MSSKKPSLLRVLSETSSIITTHPRHFSTLSALFLFPISILSTIYPLFFHPISLASQYNQLSTPVSETPPAPKSQLHILILYTSLVLFFNNCAISSITRTTINALHARPLQSLPSVKSISLDFFPILGTKLAIAFIMGLIGFAFGLFTGIIFFTLFNMNNTSTYFIVFLFLTGALLAALMIYMGLQWCLAYPVVVLESTWGVAPLRRSSYLVKGMRRVAFLMMMLFGIPSQIISIWYMNLMAVNEGRLTGIWLIVQMVVYAVFVTILSLYSHVSIAVLFVYCKELHGETVSPIDDDKSGVEFAKLPLDDDLL